MAQTYPHDMLVHYKVCHSDSCSISLWSTAVEAKAGRACATISTTWTGRQQDSAGGGAGMGHRG